MSAITHEDGSKTFDLRVEIFDHKTGKVLKHQPYRKHVKRGGEFEEIYERDGIRYLPNGECIDKNKLAAQAAQQQTKAPVTQNDPDQELT